MEPTAQIFKANKKGHIRWFIAIFAMIPILFMIFRPELLKSQPLLLVTLFIPYLLLQWIFASTVYYIDGDQFKYKSGFLKGSINLQTITRIENNRTLWVGIRPALAANGMIIHYNKFNQLYVAPEHNDELINAMLKIYPHIIIDHK